MTDEKRFELSEDYVKPDEESKELTPKVEKGSYGIPGYNTNEDGELVIDEPERSVDEQIKELWPDG